MSRLLFNEEIYTEFLLGEVLKTKKQLWIATADIKDIYVPGGRKYRPFLEVLSGLISEGVTIRLLHAKEPGPAFRADFDRFPNLWESESFERVLCPRVHFKIIIVDRKIAYSGSANLTGAGVGAKHKDKRNFEFGYIADKTSEVRKLEEEFDAVFIGNHCGSCRRRDICPDPLD